MSVSDTSTTANLAPEDSEPPGPRPDALTGTPWTGADVLTAVVVGALTAVVTLVWRTEIVSTDPWHYVQAALHFPTTAWVPLGYTRYGMILPVVPVAHLLGNAQVTYYVWAVLASATLTGSLYLVARRWWGPIAGIVAVLLTVTNWVVFLNMSRYYPDVMSMALIMAALVVAIIVRGRFVGGLERSSAGTSALLVVVGFLLGWSFEARETALLCWPIVLVVLWVRGSIRRTVVLCGLGVLVWASLDVGISALAYGNPLLKPKTLLGQNLAGTTNPSDIAMAKKLVGKDRLFYLGYVARALGGPGAPPGGFWMLVVGALATVSVVLRDRAARLSGFAFLFAYVTFAGVGGMFLPDHPFGRLDVQRYWIAFIPFASLAAAGLLHVVARFVARRVRRPHWTPALGAALAVAVLLGPAATWAEEVAASPSLAPNGGAPLGEVRAYLAAHRVDVGTVWSDRHTLRLLPAYRKGPLGGRKLWTAGVRSLTGVDPNPVKGDYVLLVRTGPQTPCGFCARALEPWLKRHHSLPSNWAPVMATTNDGMVLYRVH